MIFQGDSWFAVRAQMYDALGLPIPAQPSTAGDMTTTGEKRITTLAEIFDEREASLDARREPEPDAVASAPAKPKKARNIPPPVAPEPRPAVPEPQPPVAQTSAAPERELPSLEALKAIVTAAVRAAQRKEGPATILDLLPAFKNRTKLDFVMNAREEHRPALADLLEAAGLALEPA
jgi:hypothetical protein